MTKLRGSPTMSTANVPPARPADERGLHDREMDTPASPPRRARRAVGHDFQPYQRLVANPFLAMIGLFAWFALVRLTVQVKRIDLFVPALAAGALLFFLFQYHCMDCGATGRLSRWREHACEPVRLRNLSGGLVRPWRLSPVAQTVLWFYVLIAGAVVAFIVTR